MLSPAPATHLSYCVVEGHKHTRTHRHRHTQSQTKPFAAQLSANGIIAAKNGRHSSASVVFGPLPSHHGTAMEGCYVYLFSYLFSAVHQTSWGEVTKVENKEGRKIQCISTYHVINSLVRWHSRYYTGHKKTYKKKKRHMLHKMCWMNDK